MKYECDGGIFNDSDGSGFKPCRWCVARPDLCDPCDPCKTEALTNLESAIATLRDECPYGHPDFIPTLIEKAKLHSDKNHDYAKGGSPLGNFERAAAILALYPGLKLSDKRVVMLVYMLKQLDAILWGLSNGIEQKVEGLEKRWFDVSVYSDLQICAEKDKAKK